MAQQESGFVGTSGGFATGTLIGAPFTFIRRTRGSARRRSWPSRRDAAAMRATATADSQVGSVGGGFHRRKTGWSESPDASGSPLKVELRCSKVGACPDGLAPRARRRIQAGWLFKGPPAPAPAHQRVPWRRQGGVDRDRRPKNHPSARPHRRPCQRQLPPPPSSPARRPSLQHSLDALRRSREAKTAC
jgi:hypothetical protein